MSFPWSIEIAGSIIPLHPVIETAAIFIGFRYFLFLRRKRTDHIPDDKRTFIVIGAIFGSVIGSRLVGGMENIDALTASENVFLHFYNNKTILGGLAGGLAGVEIMKKSIGEQRASGDLFTYPIILAMIIGRIGCFGMGIHEQTFGIATSFPAGMDLGDGLLRHPVTLYEISFLLLLWVALSYISKLFVFAEGGIFKLFMMTYFLFRFLLDFIKPHYTWQIGLSTIQFVSLAGLIYYSAFILKPKKLLAVYART